MTRTKGKAILGAVCLILSFSAASRLCAKSEATFDETVKWIEKHRADLRAEWRSVEGPIKWQPEDFQNYSGMKDWYWDRTIKWTSDSECPIFGKGLDGDGEHYTISRAVSHIGSGTDVSDQEGTKDASYTWTKGVTYTWRLKVSEISTDAVVMDYKEYLQRTGQSDNRTVEVGTYYYVCIMPAPDAEADAIVEMESDQRLVDSRGPVSVVKGYKTPVSFAGVATVHDRKMADRLATAVGHLISLMQVQKRPKEPF